MGLNVKCSFLLRVRVMDASLLVVTQLLNFIIMVKAKRPFKILALIKSYESSKLFYKRFLAYYLLKIVLLFR